MQTAMGRNTAENREAVRCPRCGAEASDQNAGYCLCCGSSLGLGGRAANGERVALRMGAGLGQEIGSRPERSSTPALTPAQGAQRMSAAGQGFAAVHSHMEYESWMRDEPSCFLHLFGWGALVALGLFMLILGLTGNTHTKAGYDSGMSIAFVAFCALGMITFGGWQLAHFLQAPLLRRVARVADMRSRIQHTKHGWSTKYYATFQFEDGSQEEFRISTGESERTSRGDCGVVITRYTAMLAFHRVGCI